MVLLVEDGTGMSDAESYLSVSDTDTFHTKFGNTTWTGTEAVKEVALRKATRYIDLVYGGRWKGRVGSQAQALDWPRVGAEGYDNDYIASNVLPAALQNATAILALKALSGTDLIPDVSDPGNVVLEKIKIDVIEITEQISDGGRSPYTVFSEVEAELSELIEDSDLLVRG